MTKEIIRLRTISKDKATKQQKWLQALVNTLLKTHGASIEAEIKIKEPDNKRLTHIDLEISTPGDEPILPNKIAKALNLWNSEKKSAVDLVARALTDFEEELIELGIPIEGINNQTSPRLKTIVDGKPRIKGQPR